MKRIVTLATTAQTTDVIDAYLTGVPNDALNAGMQQMLQGVPHQQRLQQKWKVSCAHKIIEKNEAGHIQVTGSMLKIHDINWSTSCRKLASPRPIGEVLPVL